MTGFFFAAALLAPEGLALTRQGEQIIPHSPIPEGSERFAEETAAPGTAVGYCHQHVGVSVVSLWTWGGAWCLYDDEHVWKISDETAEVLLGIAQDALPVPLRYRLPSGLVLGLLGLAGAVWWRRRGL